MHFSEAKRDGTFLKFFELVLYVMFVILGFYISFLIRFKGDPSPINIDPFYNNIPYIVIASVFIFYIAGITSTYKESLFENMLIIAVSLFLINVITVAVMFFNRGFAFPRSIFIIGFIIQYVLILFSKIMILQYIKRNYQPQSILIIVSKEGSNLITEDFLSGIKGNKVESICKTVDQNTYRLIDKVDQVYIDSNVSNEDKMDVIQYCSIHNKTLYVVPNLPEIVLMSSKVKNYGDIILLKVEPLSLSFEQKVMKRVMDLVLSVIGLILTSPLFLVIALMIKLEDKGPVFYKQERVTENNKIFELYKFRTMKVDAEQHTGPILALKDDPRVTRVGRFLRTTRLDELPQLINVLKGEMSIVGPRPERPHFAEKLNKEIEMFKYRVFVKAGITGLAQILGKYTTSPENKAKLDLLYIKNYSLLLDMRIIINTLKVILKKESSMGVQEDDAQDIKTRLLEQFNIKY